MFCNLSFKEKQLIFDRVFDLKKSGFGYKRIIKKIGEEFGIKLNLSTLSYWFNNDVKMLGGENYFKAEPSSELAYVLGVMFGDGNIAFDSKKKDYCLKLEAIDKEFVEKFSSTVSRLLDKERNYAICKTNRGLYSTHGRSKQLYFFVKSIKEDFEKVKPFAEVYPAEFIQGLADSEGTASASPQKYLKLKVDVAASANLQLLEYVQGLLLRKFDITTRLTRTKVAGMTDSIIDGRMIKRTKDVFVLSVANEKQMIKYFELISFSIVRKRTKLEDAIFLLKNYNKKEAAVIWERIYHKEGRRWIRNNNIPINELNFVD